MPELKLCWLGQSGFLISGGKTEIIADPYLSDSCLKLNSRLDHTRHTPIVRNPAELTPDYYLITHPHADHFDPETIAPVMENSPETGFRCPPSCIDKIRTFFPGKEERFEFLATGKKYDLGSGVGLIAIPAAHETLAKDENGEYLSMSYLLNFTKVGKSVFIAGDTVPYAGQAAEIMRFLPDGYELSMLLPANGRDAERAALGILGNMDIDEAIGLAKECKAAYLIPCHIGMFAGNDPKEPVTKEYCESRGIRTILPEAGKEFFL